MKEVKDIEHLWRHDKRGLLLMLSIAAVLPSA